MGRPTKYKEEYNEQAYKLCLLGATDKELADSFGVSRSTINQWKIEFPDFSDALHKGKIVADAEVAHAFYKKAIGYTYTEKTIEYNKGGDIIKKKAVVKEVIPDAGAALSWLKNRQPKKWRDVTEVKQADEFANKTDQEIDQEIEELDERGKHKAG